MENLLRLKAAGLDDLEVISACLQDALTRVGDMTFLAEEGRFVVIFSRFMWENADVAPGAKGMRVRTGLHFDNVATVSTQGIDQGDREGLLPLLAVVGAPAGDGVRITLQFAGGGSLRLDAASVSAQLRDMGLPWPTPSRPDHADADRIG